MPYAKIAAIMITAESYHSTVKHILDILTQHSCWFETFEHEAVRTSEEAAKIRTGYSLSQGAKALIIQAKRSSTDRFFAMIVIPGNRTFDSKLVKKILGVKSIRFATPEEVTEVTNGIQVGGVTPWGSLFKLETYVDATLLKHEAIIFNAGDRRFSIAMKTADYIKLNASKKVNVTSVN